MVLTGNTHHRYWPGNTHVKRRTPYEPSNPAITHEKDDRIPPRQQIITVAGDLFYRHEIRAVGVEAIADAAGTNKMTLYRHFASKDELVAEYLTAKLAGLRRRLLGPAMRRRIPGDPLGQLRAWLAETAGHVASADLRGCPLANAAVELPEKDHPARRVYRGNPSSRNAARLVQLADSAGLSDPDMLADELHLLLEGARVTAQSVGADGLGALRLVRMGEAVIAAHAAK